MYLLPRRVVGDKVPTKSSDTSVCVHVLVSMNVSVCQCVRVYVSVCQCVRVYVSVCQSVRARVNVCPCRCFVCEVTELSIGL